MESENREIVERVQNKNLTPGGPGRPPGSLNKTTVFKNALEKLAEVNNKSPEEIDTDIITKALSLAAKGNYQFYKDYMDRTRGPVVSRNENLNLNANVENLPPEEKERLSNLLNGESQGT